MGRGAPDGPGSDWRVALIYLPLVGLAPIAIAFATDGWPEHVAAVAWALGIYVVPGLSALCFALLVRRRGPLAAAMRAAATFFVLAAAHVLILFSADAACGPRGCFT